MFLVKKFCFLFLVLLSFHSFGQWQSNACLEAQSFTIVVLGSSTAAGSGPSSPDSTWVNRYNDHLKTINPANEVINLAVGGYTTYHVMPDNFVSPIAGRPTVNTQHNITKALSYSPDAILINLPSNDKQWPMFEQLQNFDSLYAHANSYNVPVWIMTTQPLGGSGWASYQAMVRDSILNTFGSHAIDFWAITAANDSTLLQIYDSGDGVHQNDAGHKKMFEEVVNTDVLNSIFQPDNFPNYMPVHILMDDEICSEEELELKFIYTNLGISGDSFDVVCTIDSNSQFLNQQLFTLPAPNLCELDTIAISQQLVGVAEYTITIRTESMNDLDPENDTIFTSFNVFTSPGVISFSDTFCVGEDVELEISPLSDSSIWFSEPDTSGYISNDNQIQISNIQDDSTVYVLSINGPFDYSDSLLTTNQSSTTFNGIMFNIIADTSVLIDGLSLKVMSLGNQSISIYTKSGTFDNFQSSPVDWSLLGTSSANVTTAGDFTFFGIPTVSLVQGDTLGVYIHLSNASVGLRYQSGLSSPSLHENGQIKVQSGSGIAYAFGTSYNYRDWNGKVHYRYGNKEYGTCQSYSEVTAFVSSPEVSLPEIVTITENDSVTLNPGTFASYQWNSGSSDPFIVITESFVSNFGPYASVYVVDSVGCDAFGFSFINLLLSTENVSSEQYRIYPNPATSFLHIETDFVESKSYQLIDMNGRVVTNGFLRGQYSLNVEGFPSGTYILIIDDGGFRKSIMIQSPN